MPWYHFAFDWPQQSWHFSNQGTVSILKVLLEVTMVASADWFDDVEFVERKSNAYTVNWGDLDSGVTHLDNIFQHLCIVSIKRISGWNVSYCEVQFPIFMTWLPHCEFFVQRQCRDVEKSVKSSPPVCYAAFEVYGTHFLMVHISFKDKKLPLYCKIFVFYYNSSTSCVMWSTKVCHSYTIFLFSFLLDFRF